MKKTIKKEVRFCDACGKEEGYPYPCLLCGKEYCYECRQKLAVEYPHAVHFSGSGDGLYCKDCDAKLLRDGDNLLHQGFVAISRLRQECMAWSNDFQKRYKAAEAILAELPRGRHER